MISESLPAVTQDGALGPVLEVEGLRIERIRQGRQATIVRAADLALGPGETIGIVGESGSGKSMTARAIMGLLPKGLVASGQVRYRGLNLLELPERELQAQRGGEIGLILQDPFTMLNPVMTCGKIIGESLLRERRLSRDARREEVVRRLAEVGIRDASVADRYPFQLSGGMRQRVGIAAALARDPRVLLADEPTTALDVTTQREVLALIKGIQAARGMSLILITHDLRVAFAVCDRVYVLYAGSLIEVGRSAELDAEPLHPYTLGLLLSEPSAERRTGELMTIPGSVPAPDDVAGSCTFAPRCRWAAPACTEGSPPLAEVAPGRLSACVRVSEIRAEMAILRRQGEKEVDAGPSSSGAATALIQVQDARKVFRNGRRTVAALDGVSIEVGENESVGIVGESGSGKTTLARILVGLEQPTSGQILIGGIPASNWANLSSRDQRKLRSTIQIVFQDPYSSLNPMRSIGSILREAIAIGEPEMKDRNAEVGNLLRSVGLPADYAARKPVALSGGERQRVAIARVLAAQPRILICDEPVSALDMSVQAQILNLLIKLRTERGLGYLFITHDLSIVRQVTERLYVMHGGKVVESGPTEDVLSNPRDPYTATLLKSVPRPEPEWLAATN
ncbi:MAG TPA: ABC transporter ATP-binding protein [Streptosporangiaceae bacterium]|nr:ABC transporter ATP-binding protein [Streptosporangiaceae bacterium]